MKNMKNLLPIKEYANSLGVSTNTVKNWANEGNANFELIKVGSRNYVKLHEMKTEISENNNVIYERLLAEKEIEIQRLNSELQGKSYEIKGLEKQIENLLRENSEKQTIIIGMQQQMTAMTQNNTLLLETSKEQKKRKKFLGIF
ncbi:hypothetical protein [Oceanivirga miroungae]|uniref:Uncharacterized protein n=1 Tax=Oceanivirga miroungae TaxID=1130046 RepID=A0A6I8MCK9_9FUSO|nr:hypothetical protein [Oceanivirga miroungae]VWL89628.1 hypothetical protein OMES3154_01282 [Oceanivirga miroungae]